MSGRDEEMNEVRPLEAESLAKTERAILAFARREQPESLQDLRARLAVADLPVDERLVNLAILQLLNTDRLNLSIDRQLYT